MSSFSDLGKTILDLLEKWRAVHPDSPNSIGGQTARGAVYGPPVPVVWGTARVERKVLYLGPLVSSGANVNVYTGWTDSESDWGRGVAAPAVLGFCLGAQEVLRLYVGQDSHALDGYTVTAGVDSSKTLRRILADPAEHSPPWEGTAGSIVLSPTTPASDVIALPANPAYGMVWKGIVQIRTPALSMDMATKVPAIGLEVVGRCVPSAVSKVVAAGSSSTVVKLTVSSTLPAGTGAYVVFTSGALSGQAARGTISGDTFTLESGSSLPSTPVATATLRLGQLDAHPIDVVRDILTDANVGLGIDASLVVTDVGPDGLSRSSARTYVDNMTSWRVSRAVSDFSQAGQLIDDILEACNCEIIYSEGKFKVWPLGDTPIGTYVPASWDTGSSAWTPVLLDADEIGRDSLATEQSPESETFNVQPISFKDRTKGYEDTTVTVQDDSDVETNGPRIAGGYSNPWITTSTHAQQIAQLKVGFMLHRRNLFREITLAPRWIALEPGDLVQISDGLGINHTARITKTDENERGIIKIEARQWTTGASHPLDLTTQESEGGSPLPSASIATQAATTAQAAKSGAIDAGSISQSSVANAFTDNLYPNPTSEMAPPASADLTAAEWSGRYNAGAGAYAGEWDRRVVTAAAGAGGTRYQELPAVRVPCIPGEIYYLSSQVKQVTAVNGSTKGYVAIRFYDGAGAQIGSDVVTATHESDGNWHERIVMNATAPAASVTAAAVLGVDCTAGVVAGEEYQFDAILFRRVPRVEGLTLGSLIDVGTGWTINSQSLTRMPNGIAVMRIRATRSSGTGTSPARVPAGFIPMADIPLTATDTTVSAVVVSYVYMSQYIEIPSAQTGHTYDITGVYLAQ